MLTDIQIKELQSGAYGTTIRDALLSKYTTFHIGGPADLIVEPKSEEEIIRTVKYLKSERIPFYILGNGSNILVKDGGFRGVIIHLGKNYSDCFVEGNIVRAQSGALLSSVAKLSFKTELSGMEEISGIPGTVGGAVVMNAGAYNGEMKNVVKEVKAINKDNNIVTLKNEECDFAYRTSRIMKENLIVLEVVFELVKGNASEINEKYGDYSMRRKTKQPLEKHSAGSTFKRPEKGYASKLIDEAGLRGYAVNDAKISDKHCGFLINDGNATAEDVLNLISDVQKKVYDEFSIQLEPEVRIIGED